MSRLYSHSREYRKKVLPNKLCIGFVPGGKLNFLWPKMARLGPPFWLKNPAEKVYVGPSFCVLSQEMRHINFFLGDQNGGFWVMCFFGPLKSLCATKCTHFSTPTSIAKGPWMWGNWLGEFSKAFKGGFSVEAPNPTSEPLLPIRFRFWGPAQLYLLFSACNSDFWLVILTFGPTPESFH